MLHVGHTQVAVDDNGSGVPTLLLHGNPDTRRMWRPMCDGLTPHLRCIAPDLPGFGDTRAPLDLVDVSLDGMADWVDGVLNALHVQEPVNLVVHDFGGPYGLAWAVRHPQRVRRIVIINTLFHADYRWHFWARVWRTRGLGELSMAMLGIPVLGPALLALTIKLGAPGLTWRQIVETGRHFGPETRRMVLKLYRATNPENFPGWEDEMLALTARVPTRVIWGMRDPFIPQGFADRFGTNDVHRFDDAGHWVAMEEPDRTARLVLEHLRA
jgi:pimeloyl-ACP methyl ester carboxylesterase